MTRLHLRNKNMITLILYLVMMLAGANASCGYCCDFYDSLCQHSKTFSSSGNPAVHVFHGAASFFSLRNRTNIHSSSRQEVIVLLYHSWQLVYLLQSLCSHCLLSLSGQALNRPQIIKAASHCLCDQSSPIRTSVNLNENRHFMIALVM